MFILVFASLIFLFSFASPCGGVLFCCWCHVTCRLFSCLLISWLLYSCPVCAASIAGPPVRVHVWLSPRMQLVLCSRLVRVRCCWYTVYALAIFFFGRGTSSPSRCHRRTASSVWRAAHCTVHIEGSRRSAVIGLCRPLWRPLASAAEGADSLPAGQSVSAGGDTRAKRAVSEVWVGTPVPVDYPCLDGRPLFQQLPRQPSQRSRPVPRAKEKSFSEILYVLYIYKSTGDGDQTRGKTRQTNTNRGRGKRPYLSRDM